MPAADTAEQDVVAYQVEGDFVIGSSESADAWISAPFTIDLTEAR